MPLISLAIFSLRPGALATVAALAGGNDVRGAVPSAPRQRNAMVRLDGSPRECTPAVVTLPSVHVEAREHGVERHRRAGCVGSLCPKAQAMAFAVSPRFAPCRALFGIALAIAAILRCHAVRMQRIPLALLRSVARPVRRAPGAMVLALTRPAVGRLAARAVRACREFSVGFLDSASRAIAHPFKIWDAGNTASGRMCRSAAHV